MRKRPWQNWDQEFHRHRVERFWHDHPEQAERRQHFHEELRSIVSRATDRGLTDRRVLDFGCGTCEDAGPMEDIGLRYEGCDVTPQMIEDGLRKHPRLQGRLFHADLLSDAEMARWPIVVNSAVLPHLPAGMIPRALRTLWRVTSFVLVVRAFGVDLHAGDKEVQAHGFHYSRLRESSWRRLFEELRSAPKEIDIVRGQTPATKDILIASLWRTSCES